MDALMERWIDGEMTRWEREKIEWKGNVTKECDGGDTLIWVMLGDLPAVDAIDLVENDAIRSTHNNPTSTTPTPTTATITTIAMSVMTTTTTTILDCYCCKGVA